MQRWLFLAAAVAVVVVATTGFLQARAQSDLDEGRRLAEQGDVKGALEVYEAAVASQPDDREAHLRLGGMQLLDQRYGEAIQTFQRAIALGADASQAFIGMGMAYLHLGQYGPARAALEEAKARGSSRTSDIDQILAWLDQREGSGVIPQVHP